MIALAFLAGALLVLMAVVIASFVSAASVQTPPVPSRPIGEDDDIEWRDGTE